MEQSERLSAARQAKELGQLPDMLRAVADRLMAVLGDSATDNAVIRDVRKDLHAIADEMAAADRRQREALKSVASPVRSQRTAPRR